MRYNGIEMLIVQAARQVRPGEVVFAGVGLPIISMAVAKRFYCPDITIICESGIVDTTPTRLALSVADPVLADNSAALFTPNEIFTYFLQGGRIDLGVLGGAQIDRYGNINSTVIGPYDKPKVRMPGSGGACEIALHAKEVLILTPQSKRRFVERVDFVTSAGHSPEGPRTGMTGKGPRAVVSDLGRYEFDSESKEMSLTGLFEGVGVDRVLGETGWPIRVVPQPETLGPPTDEELAFIRGLDPERIFLGKKG